MVSSLKHLIQKKILENPIYFLSLLWIIILFSLHSYVWFINYGIFGIPILESTMGFSDASSWLAVATDISRGVIFPNTPSLGNGGEGLMFFPYFSLWIYGLFIYIFGTTFSLLILQIILPTIVFFLMIQIYRIYLPFMWSLALTSLSLISYSNMDFRDFLLKIIYGDGWSNFLSGEQLGIASTPFPSLNMLFFLLAFFLTFNNKKFLSNLRITLLTILWSVQIYFHLINALVGLPLWFITLFIWLKRDKQSYNYITILKKFFIQIAITFLILIPSIISIMEFSNFQNLDSSFGLISESTFNQVPNYVLIANFALPLLLLALAYYFFKVDKFELLIKFLPIFLLMLIELFLIVLRVTTGIGLDINLIFNRIGTVFLHLFYFVPSLYYLSRDIYFNFNYKNSYKIKFQKLINQFFNSGSKFYLPILLILLTFYSLASLSKFNSRLKEVRLEIKDQQSIIKYVSEITEIKKTIVSDKLKTNFIFPSVNSYGTLLVNRSVNKISLLECVERLTLWSKIRGLERSHFIKFMSPNKKLMFLPNSFLVSNDNLSGIGYWLCLGRTFLNDEKSKKYNFLVDNTFNNFNFQSSIKKFNITTLIVSNNFPIYENYEKIKSFNNINIYKTILRDDK